MYKCPICKQLYTTEARVKSCFEYCISEDVRRVYKCMYCGEAYDNNEDATECAMDCYKREHSLVSFTTEDVSGKCVTCANCDNQDHKIYPCPHRFGVDDVDGCEAYEPDVRTFGTFILTEWTLDTVHPACQGL